MRAKDVNESVIQQPFTNNTRNQPISGSYPLSMMQYEDSDKPEWNPDYEELHKQDHDSEKAYAKFKEEEESLKLTKEDFENAKPGDVFYMTKGDNVYKVVVDEVTMMKHRMFSSNRKSPPEITIISRGGKTYRVGSLLRSKPQTELNVVGRGLMDPRNFKGNDYHDSYEKYRAKYESKNNEDMRAREVNEDWESELKAKEKVWNAEYRAEDNARKETYKPMKKAYVLPIGVVSPANGNTMYDWNIYESWPDGWAFLLKGFLIFSSDENDFEIGEDVVLYGNDSGRRLTYANKVADKAPVQKEALVNMLFKHGYDYKPKRAFQKAAFSNKLSTSYSVKGITYDEIKPHKRHKETRGY
jgi:hypothetical protein